MNIIDFWSGCPVGGFPLCHPEDSRVLLSGNIAVSTPLDLDSFKRQQFGSDDGQFHLSLIPVPYNGDLRAADIFVLTLNPGLHPSDYEGEFRIPGFREYREANLRQSPPGACPLLKPEFVWHAGFTYWEKKLRPVATVLATREHGGSYAKALAEVSRRVAVLQLIPYHSFVFKSDGLVEKLASTRAARRFAREELIPRALRGDALVVAVRAVRKWGLEPSENVVLYEGGLCRGASLGLNTPGGKAMLQRLLRVRERRSE